jgi:hypothetical protein
LVVEKEDQKIPDTPENYGVLIAAAIANAQDHFGTANLQIVIDRHFSSRKDREKLVTLLMGALALSEPPTFADSQTSPLVQLVDFVAGAYHAKLSVRAASQYGDLTREGRCGNANNVERTESQMVRTLSNKEAVRTQRGYFENLAALGERCRPSNHTLALLLPLK